MKLDVNWKYYDNKLASKKITDKNMMIMMMIWYLTSP